MPDGDVAGFVRLNGLQGRLLTYFDYGEYAIWHFPKLKVSYDGRRETVYSPEVQRAHGRFYFDKDHADYARAIDADYIWIPRALPVGEALLRDGWIPIFHGRSSVLLARTAASSYVQPPFSSAERCFPGP